MSYTPTPEELEIQQQRAAAMEQNMAAAGVETTEKVRVDYFDFEVDHVVTLPDGISTVTHRELSEGARAKYQASLQRDITLQKATGDAKISMNMGAERIALLEAAIVDFDLMSRGQPVKFTPQNLKKFLTGANPKVLDVIEKDVRLKNPWLLGEVSVEDIDEEIANLEEIRAKKLEEAAGNAPS